jgi:hypothetical protein
VWVRALHSIVQHECFESHLETSLKYKLYQTFLLIIPLLVVKQQQVKALNREVVRSLIDITFFFSKKIALHFGVTVKFYLTLGIVVIF